METCEAQTPDMEPVDRVAISNVLTRQSEAIAEAWYQAVAASEFSHLPPKKLKLTFIELTDKVIQLLLAESAEPEQARAIGKEIANRYHLHPVALGATIETLSNCMTEHLTAEQARELQPRLFQIMSAIAVGFHEASQSIVLEEQDNIRRALFSAWEQSEQARRNLVKQSQSILRALPDSLIILTLDGMIEYYQPGPDRNLPATSAVEGRHILDILPPEIYNAVLISAKKAIETSDIQVLEFPLVIGAGTFFLENRIVPHEPGKVVILSRNITEEKSFEEALRASEARFRSVVEDQTELINRWLPDSTLTFVNGACCRFSGRTEKELLGTSFLPFVHPDDHPIVLTSIAKLTPQEPIAEHVVRVQRPDGEIRWLAWTTRAIFDQGKIIEYQSVGRDVTPLRRTRIALTQKNAELQSLTKQLITAQENERQRIAQELHDVVLNGLGALAVSPPEMVTPQAVQASYQTLIEQVRQTIDGLRPAMLNFGLYSAIEEYVDHISERFKPCQAILKLSQTPVRFDPDVELHLFRIVQQACENALKHAHASRIVINGLIDESQVHIAIEDNGVGFALENPSDLSNILAQKRYGLSGMLERGALIAATVEIHSKPGEGTTIKLHWTPQNQQLNLNKEITA